MSNYGSILYVATLDTESGLSNKIVAIKTINGSVLWQTSLLESGFAASSLLSGDGKVLYSAAYDGSIYGFSPTNGSILWKYTPSVGESFDSSPAVDFNGTIFIGGFTGTLYAIGK